jgi:signal peptide peptidase SppA
MNKLCTMDKFSLPKFLRPNRARVAGGGHASGLSGRLSTTGGGGGGRRRANVIALVNVRGTIQDGEDKPAGLRSENGQNFEKLRPLIEQAFELPAILAVILLINSPGGSPTQTNLISKFVRQKREETGVPVYALVEDIAASGGYWLACAADEIYADENSMVGSIGVVSLNVGLAGLLRKYGVYPRVQVTGKNKASMHPLVDYSEAQEQLIRESMSCIQNNFTTYVRQRRPALRAKDVDPDVFTGRVFVGRRALKVGLIDGVATLNQLLDTKFPGREDLQLLEVKLKTNLNLINALAGLLRQSAFSMLSNMSHMCEEMTVASPTLTLTSLTPEINLA